MFDREAKAARLSKIAVEVPQQLPSRSLGAVRVGPARAHWTRLATSNPSGFATPLRRGAHRDRHRRRPLQRRAVSVQRRPVHRLIA
jgi:hypothetical protein